MATSDRSDNPPIVAIVGETASGKSALALRLAGRFNGEIIAADSRTVYKGMDIGTAKPSAAELQRVRHYGIDVVEPGQPFSAADFKRLAEAAIQDISGQGKLPIIVGGSGLYIDAITYDFQFRALPDPALRAELQTKTVPELQARVLAAGLLLPSNTRNPRHLIRLIESGPAPIQSRTLRPNTLVIGISQPNEVLRERISERVELMVASGLIAEIQKLIQVYGSTEAFRAPGYKAFGAYIRGELSLEEAKRQFIRADLQLAKRQRTWFKRNKSIHWLQPDCAFEQATALLEDLLYN